MTKKIFRCSNGDIIEKQAVKQSSKGSDKEKDFLVYRFEFTSDEKIYSASFNGKISFAETEKMLKTVQNCLYEKMSINMQSYLEQQHIEYSNFISYEFQSLHNKIMDIADCLLHSYNCDKIDSFIGNTDVYYAIADYRNKVENGYYEGCYYAIKRISANHKNKYKYNIINQIFHYSERSEEENGCFAIRASRDSRQFYDIVKTEGETVLPTFGCVDMMGLLLDIDNLMTAEQAQKAAIGLV